MRDKIKESLHNILSGNDRRIGAFLIGNNVQQHCVYAHQIDQVIQRVSHKGN